MHQCRFMILYYRFLLYPLLCNYMNFLHLSFCIYVFCCSHSHHVTHKGKCIAFVSIEAYTEQPEKGLQPGLNLLGAVDEDFFNT